MRNVAPDSFRPPSHSSVQTSLHTFSVTLGVCSHSERDRLRRSLADRWWAHRAVGSSRVNHSGASSDTTKRALSHQYQDRARDVGDEANTAASLVLAALQTRRTAGDDIVSKGLRLFASGVDGSTTEEQRAQWDSYTDIFIAKYRPRPDDTTVVPVPSPTPFLEPEPGYDSALLTAIRHFVYRRMWARSTSQYENRYSKGSSMPSSQSLSRR